MHLDDIDKRLLNLLQRDFPLLREPFSAMGARLGISGEEVILRIERLKAAGVIREIGPVFDPRSLGYQTTLVAMRLPNKRLNQVAELINQHPGVSHNYARDHHFNLWFTLALPGGVEMQSELQKLAGLSEAEAFLDLPALKVFKIGAYFDVAGDGSSMPGTEAERGSTHAELSPGDRAVINELQQDLPLNPRPFEAMSEHVAMDASEFLELCQSLQKRGVMRRFSAAIRHNEVGAVANAMSCWVVPSAMVEVAGSRVAARREVSHCYERKAGPLWPYNLFAMIHGHTREACQATANELSGEIGINECVLLFSVKEFKKTRVRYLV